MGKIGRDPDFVEKSLWAEGGGEFLTQHLDGHASMMTQVLREIHRGHPASADFALDTVAVGESGPEPLQRLSQTET